LVARCECEKPVLAGVNGVAVGMGVSLAMCADFRIAAPSARFHPGYARVGASPDGGLTWTLPEAIGYERAMRFFFEQRMVSASDALAWGMVGEVTESDEAFEARFLEYGQMLAAVAPIAAQQTKRLVGRIARPPELQAHLTEEIRLTLAAFTTEDSKEAVRAMTARERPTFTGR
jgi:2-(1,2-epoxy-1,2-dihydrophenyl)acetyl-CoA isomerase